MASIERKTIYKVLKELFDKKGTLDFILKKYLSDRVKRNQVYNTVYGVLRNLNKFENYINLKLKKKTESGCLIILYMALFELIFLKTKEYATLNEALNLAYDTSNAKFKGLINAILRNFLRNKKEELKILNSFNPFPENISNLIKENFYKNFKKVEENLLTHPPVFIVPNLKLINTSSLKEKLLNEGVDVKGSDFLYTYDLDLLKSKAFFKGLFFIQDLSAQIACEMLDVKETDTVLDLCSAPGGKTLNFASKVKELVSVEKSSKRMEKIFDNINRLKVKNVQVLEKDVLKLDLNKKFDKVFIDPPCSSLGVLRRHPDIVLKNFNKETLAKLSCLQESLVLKACSFLKEGGTLVYSVCTFTKEETLDVIKKVLIKDTSMKILKPNKYFSFLNKENFVMTLPNDKLMDGHFIAVMRKNGK
jgi:16S rRNA (cytosine967-C5)-methyltransferase